MRSDQASKETLTLEIELMLKKDVEEHYKKYEEINQEKFESGERPNFGIIKDTLGLRFMKCVAFAYTRGDSLESIDKTFMQPAVERLLRFCTEIDKRKMQGKEWFWPSGENLYFGEGNCLEAYNTVSIFTFYAWLLCFDTPKDKIEALSHYITPAGSAISVDTVIGRFQSGREIGENNSQKSELFPIWTNMFTLKGDEQIAVIKDYLNNWAKYLTHYHGVPFASLATYLNMKHKSNKTLVKQFERNEHMAFYGYWAWEVALAVKFCGVDDTEFRDHPLYPVDAVDYIKG